MSELVLICLRAVALFLSGKACYLSGLYFLREFVREGLDGKYTAIYAGLFMFSVALIFLNCGFTEI